MARARPNRRRDHADGSQFVLGLHDGVAGFAGFGVRAEAAHVADQSFDQRGGRRDGIPRHNDNAGEHGAQRAGRVAIDDDFAGGLVRALHPIRVRLGEVAGGVIEAGLRGAPVQIGRLGLLRAELFDQGLAHIFHFDGEKICHHAVVDHVAHQLAQLGLRGTPAPPACRRVPDKSAGRSGSD